MKNFTLLMAVWTLSALSAQLLAQLNYLGSFVDRPDRTELNQYFNNYQLYEISVTELENYLRAPDSDGALNLILDEEQQWSLELFPDELRSPDFQLKTLTPSGVQTLPNLVTPTFRGTVNGAGKVALTIYNDYLSLWIKDGNQQYFLESASRFDRSFKSNIFVVYEPDQVRNDAPGRCASRELHDLPHGNPNILSAENLVCRQARIAVASDYSMVEDLGGILETHLHALQILSLVNSDWNDNDFADDVFFTMTEHLISSCADCDPWTDSTQAEELLSAFRDWAVADGFNIKHDLGQLWTTRDLCNAGDCGVIGLATLSSVCTSSPYHLLEKNTNTSALLRSLASHEIGHNFSLSHNYEVNDGCDLNGRIPYIMDPVNQGAVDWSDGNLDCDVNNVAALALYLPSLECIDDCIPNNCPSIQGLSITEQTDSTIVLDWEANASGNYRAVLRDVVNNIYLDTIMTSTPGVDFGIILERCGTYQVLVQSQCSNGSVSEYTNILFETDQTNQLELLEVRIADCFAGIGTYDLRIDLAHNGGDGEGFRVAVNTDTSLIVFPYGNSPRQIILSGLNADGGSVDLKVFPVTDGGGNCESSYRYTAPKEDCSLSILEDFNNGIPSGWEVTTNRDDLSVPYEWSVGGEGRFAISYRTNFDSTAASIDATIDSTDMLYFDDDIITQDIFTGTTSIVTPEMDLRSFANLTLDFDYMFDRVDDPADPFVFFGNKPVETDSYFSVEVYDGSDWQEVHLETTNDCGFFDIWNSGCVNSLSLDVSEYANAKFQIRFTYSDGENGTWAGMIAVDNVLINGNFDVSLPVTLTEFTGRKKGTTAELEWITEMESDNDYFTLERSADGRSFQAIGKIKGQGTSLSGARYNYTDSEPLPGNNYYRLRQTDFDGTTNYTGEIIVLNFVESKERTIRPNPVGTDHFFIEAADGGGNEFQKILIYNSGGQLVKEAIIGPSETNKISVDHLTNGIYFLSIQTETRTETHRLVIMR